MTASYFRCLTVLNTYEMPSRLKGGARGAIIGGQEFITLFVEVSKFCKDYEGVLSAMINLIFSLNAAADSQSQLMAPCLQILKERDII
jgi:hypothetical protein